MKLLSKYYRVNIFATVIVVVLSSACYYLVIHYILNAQLDDSLKVEEQEVTDYIKEQHKLPEPSSYKDQQVYFMPGTGKNIKRSFSSITFHDKEGNENGVARQLCFPVKVSSQTFIVYVVKSQEETENLINLILIITFIIVLLLLIILFLINRFILRRLWKPFDSTLFQLKQFALSGENTLNLQYGPVDEFNELNKAVSIMARHVSQEYRALKNFTENASHEMQTPLAIINSKLDLLIQGDNITEQQMGQMQGIYNAVDRLTRLNESLLLLTKIENNQFKEIENISLDKAIAEKLLQFEGLIDHKNLRLLTELQPRTIRCNNHLLDILLSNLLNNAIRYNFNSGTISILLKNRLLIFSNSSEIGKLDESKIFQRFYRHEDSKQNGNGLGLSIVKQICNDFNYDIHYLYKDSLHYFHINY